MQPYQEASEEILRQSKQPGKILSNLATTAAGLTGGGAVLNRVLPLLDRFIPADIAVKGLNKIDNRLGKFIKGALEQGHPVEEVMSFIKEKSSTQQEKPPEKTNIIGQYSDKLKAFIEDHISKGRAPLEAGALAQLDDKYKTIIKKMEEDHKAPFSSIIEAVYGQKTPKTQSAQQPQQMQQQQNTNANTDEALLAALDKILKM